MEKNFKSTDECFLTNLKIRKYFIYLLRPQKEDSQFFSCLSFPPQLAGKLILAFQIVIIKQSKKVIFSNVIIFTS
jgi:hypothetical protein